MARPIGNGEQSSSVAKQANCGKCSRKLILVENIVLINISSQESENTTQLVQKSVEAININLNEKEFISTRLSEKLNAPILIQVEE